MNSSVFLTAAPARGGSIITSVVFVVVIVALVWIPILNNPKQFKDKRTVLKACAISGGGLIFIFILNYIPDTERTILMMVLVVLSTISIIIKSPRTKKQADKTSPTETVHTDGSRIEKLTKLKGLLDVGAITQEEFDEKKKELLNQ